MSTKPHTFRHIITTSTQMLSKLQRKAMAGSFRRSHTKTYRSFCPKEVLRRRLPAKEALESRQASKRSCCAYLGTLRASQWGARMSQNTDQRALHCNRL